MKKLIGAVAIAAVLATSAFAEITFGAWLRTMVVPVSGDGSDVKAFMSNCWAKNIRPARLGVTGVTEDEKAGMKLDFFPDDYEFNSGDHVYTWVRPIEQIRISVGRYGDNDTGLRGDFAYGSWNWMRPYNGIRGDEGFTFSDINTEGLRLEIFPVEGLTIVGSIPFPVGATDVEDVYSKTSVTAAYEIDGIGRVKAQWLGKNEKNEAKDKYLGDIEVAFDLTAVENLYITVGAAFGIMDSDYYVAEGKQKYKSKDYDGTATKVEELFEKDGDPAKASAPARTTVTLGASYNVLENFKVSLSGGVMFFNKPDGIDVDPRWGIGLGLDYGFTDSLSLVADVRYLSKVEVKAGGKVYDTYKDSLSFLIGLDYNVNSNAILGIGFQGVTNGNGFVSSQLQNGDKFAWAVPLKVQLAL